MSPEEVLAFLDEERTLTCATIGPDAWPHLMPLWYVVTPEQAAKRVALQFISNAVASWDHRKLAA